MYKGSIKIKELEEEIGKGKKWRNLKKKSVVGIWKKRKSIYLFYGIYTIRGQIYRSICRKKQEIIY